MKYQIGLYWFEPEILVGGKRTYRFGKDTVSFQMNCEKASELEELLVKKIEKFTKAYSIGELADDSYLARTRPKRKQ